jgi:hypothetical protein
LNVLSTPFDQGMNRFILILSLQFCLLHTIWAGNGLGKAILPNAITSSPPSSTPSRLNIKIQPAIFWATLGLEAEYVISPKITVALNVLGKIGRTDGKTVTYKIKQEDFLKNGYMAELIGRYYISLSKKKLKLAPMGFYVQISGGYSKLLYFDGATRPFSLFARSKKPDDPRSPSDFEQPQPFVGGLGCGYQVELLPKKVIANMLIGAQANSDNKGFFLSLYVSPSIGIMF